MDVNKVLARVGEREITQIDLEFLLKSLDPQTAMQFQSEEGKKRLLEELVNQELLYINAIDNKFHEEEDFKIELETIKTNFLKQYAINKLLNNVTINDAEIETYYHQNKLQFKTPESVNASHILVDSEEKANEIIGELENGLPFDEAAQKYSKCPSKAQGGNLGYFTKGKMVPEFEKAAFSVQKNEISKPIKTQYGYHIIKVIDKREEEIQPLNNVKDKLSQQLLSMKQHKVYMDKIEELKNHYTVEINL